MTIWIALLRGINVGGHNRLQMTELAQLLATIGCTSVQIYIQSGNVVFASQLRSANRLADTIASTIHARHGFRPAVCLLRPAELQAVVARNPFLEAVDEPKSLHVFFLEKECSEANRQAALGLIANGERCRFDGRYCYLHAPQGVGRSRFVREIDRVLNLATTARNWRTVEKLVQLAGP